MYKLLLYVILLLFCQCKRDHSLKEEVTDLLRTEIVIRGDKALAEEPVTITAYRAERSAGGIHDFYSEGDYWWPNPINPDSAYIRRDGQTNPDNFVAHRHAMIRFSSLVGDLTSAWLVTKDEKYIRQAVKHIRAWFIAPETRMNPDLQYAQAIKGIVTGRGIGIIDTIHLLEVVQSLIRMEEAGVLAVEDVAGSRTWFSDYLKWFKVFCNLSGHPELWDSIAMKALDDVAEVLCEIPDGNAPRVLSMFANASTLEANTSSTVVGGMVSAMKAVNIVDSWDNTEGADRLTINLETVLAADPDIIIVQCHAGTDAAKAQVEETYGSNPVWQSLSAVKNGKVFYLEKSLFHNKPNSRFAQAYQQLAQILYPDADFSFKSEK